MDTKDKAEQISVFQVNFQRRHTMKNDFQVNDSLRLFGSTFSADMIWKNVSESVVRTAAKKLGSLCHVRHFFLKYLEVYHTSIL